MKTYLALFYSIIVARVLLYSAWFLEFVSGMGHWYTG